MIDYISIIPFFAIVSFIIFLKKNHLNSFLSGLIFVSYLFFATNYANFGLDIDIFRYIHRLIGIVLIIFLLVHFVRFKINFLKDQVFILFALFFATLLLSYIGNEIYFPYYYHYVRNFIFISTIVFYLYYFIDSNDKVYEILKLIVYLTLIITFFTLIEKLNMGFVLATRGSLNLFEAILASSRVDLYFGNPNYLAISLIPGFTLALFSRNKILNTLSLVILIAIYFTGSRAGLLSAIFSILTYIYYKDFNKIYLVPVLISIVFLSVVFFDKILINKDKSISRLAFAAITYNIFQQNPFNGIGYGQFRKNFHKYVDIEVFKLKNHEVNESFIANNPDTPFLKLDIYNKMNKRDLVFIQQSTFKEKMTHNDLLTIIAELGLIGVSFLLIFFLRLYLELKKLLLHSRSDYYLSIALIGSSLVFSFFHNNMTSFMFWFVLIIPFIINRNFQIIAAE